MAKLITQHNLDAAELQGFKKETQNLIRTALVVGWTGHPAVRGNITLKSPSGQQTIHLSKASRRNASGPIQQMLRKVLTHGDQMLVANLSGYSTGSIELTNAPTTALAPVHDLPDELIYEAFESRIPVDVMITLKRVPPKEIRVILKAFLDANVTFDSERELALNVIKVYEIKKQTLQEQKEESVAVKSDAKSAIRAVAQAPKKETRRLISVHPYMSKSSKGTSTTPGKAYESPVALEQRWSDGTVNYKCKLCPMEADVPLSVVSHWKKHTNAGEVPVVGSRAGVLVEDPNNIRLEPRIRLEKESEHEYQPREERVAALAAELLQAMEGKHGETPAEIADRLARRALTWAHEQKGTGLPRDPQTPEEIIAAIRDMVDRGEYAKMREAALEAEQQADEAQVRAERAEARNNKLGADLKALRDLISAVGNDDEDDSERV